jgi:hypothetical protein
MKLGYELLIDAHWSIQSAHEIVHPIKAGRVPRAGHQNPGQPEQLGKR